MLTVFVLTYSKFLFKEEKRVYWLEIQAKTEKVAPLIQNHCKNRYLKLVLKSLQKSVLPLAVPSVRSPMLLCAPQ